MKHYDIAPEQKEKPSSSLKSNLPDSDSRLALIIAIVMIVGLVMASSR